MPFGIEVYQKLDARHVQYATCTYTCLHVCTSMGLMVQANTGTLMPHNLPFVGSPDRASLPSELALIEQGALLTWPSKCG